MSIKLLDCTLRDGGYQNEWQFGYSEIRKITRLLTEANIDIVECGFLTQSIPYYRETTKFNTIEQLVDILPNHYNNTIYVAMMNYGEVNTATLPECDGSISGLRVAFHKKDWKEALGVCVAIKEKGYKVFIQAMVSLSYSDMEFLSLIEHVNAIEPYAFYIVDSFGAMKKKDLLRLFYLTEQNLSETIKIGFHSHNNLQLAYSNAISLTELQSEHDLIIDASVYGMGRGAGNLNLELFAEHLNANFGSEYRIEPLLVIIDDILNGFYKRNYWGYSLSNYISAKHNVHPNYASYLDDLNALTFERLDELIAMIADSKKCNFDKKYIDDLYIRYMSRNSYNKSNMSSLKTRVEGNEVLIVCPGKSSETERECISDIAKSTLTFSVNFDYSNTDYIFVSNIKRYRQLDEGVKPKTIATTNIPADGVFTQPIYSELLTNVDSVRDNAGLMLIKFVIALGASKIFLAGMDGYSHDTDENYGKSKMAIIMRNAVMDVMNNGMSEALTRYAAQIPIEFLTPPKYIDIRKR